MNQDVAQIRCLAGCLPKQSCASRFKASLHSFLPAMTYVLRFPADVATLVKEMSSWTLWQTREASRSHGTPSAHAVKAGLAETLPVAEIMAEEGWSFYDVGVAEELPPVGACHEAAPWCPSLVAELRKRPELLGAGRDALDDMLEELYTGNEMEECSIGNSEIEREEQLGDVWWHCVACGP